MLPLLSSDLAAPPPVPKTSSKRSSALLLPPPELFAGSADATCSSPPAPWTAAVGPRAARSAAARPGGLARRNRRGDLRHRVVSPAGRRWGWWSAARRWPAPAAGRPSGARRAGRPLGGSTGGGRGRAGELAGLLPLEQVPATTAHGGEHHRDRHPDADEQALVALWLRRTRGVRIGGVKVGGRSTAVTGVRASERAGRPLTVAAGTSPVGGGTSSSPRGAAIGSGAGGGASGLLSASISSFTRLASAADADGFQPPGVGHRGGHLGAHRAHHPARR